MKPQWIVPKSQNVIQVYFVKSSIPLAVKRVPLWTEKVEKLGGDIEKVQHPQLKMLNEEKESMQIGR